MKFDRRRNSQNLSVIWLFLGVITSTAFFFAIAPTEATVRLSHPESNIKPTQEITELALNDGDITVTGEKGKYTVHLLVNASRDTVWKVLTNYTELSRFMPDLVSSKVVENKGRQKILDQVYSSSYTMGQKFNVRVMVTEVYPRGLSFRLIRGDYLNFLEGTWKIEPVSENNSKQLLLTHEINIDPNLVFGKNIFYKLYKQSLEDAMIRLKQEIETR
jgi:ribosome-associated toxin RatA of RatAB toxin-antitoxin module